MRGPKRTQQSMLSLRTPEQRVPQSHPLRAIKTMADKALDALSSKFDEMYSSVGRPSVPPEQLLKGSLLIALFSIRSERQLCEQLDYNLLYRWFLDMGTDDEPFDHSVFSANRERMVKHEVGQHFLNAVVDQARAAGLMSSEHFTVDGTLIEAWASLKSFRPKAEKPEDRPPPDDPGNPTVNFHGEKRSNDTHESTTDPDARLARKSNGQTAKLSYCLNGLTENRHGLLVDLQLETATGTAERDAAVAMVFRAVPGNRRITLGADKGYDTKDFVADCRQMNVTPHVARRKHSAIAERYSVTAGYLLSQRKRKLVEEVWGWMKEVGCFRKCKLVGKGLVAHAANLVGVAFNLRRMATLLSAA
jgi:transposase